MNNLFRSLPSVDACLSGLENAAPTLYATTPRPLLRSLTNAFLDGCRRDIKEGRLTDSGQLGLDALLPQLTPESFRHLGRRTPLLVLAVTLHNIPEGMAVGISFALASQGDTPAQLTAAVALALGIGIQNFPEGAAIALPLRQEGLSRAKSFWMGALSGVVEPIFALLTVLMVGSLQPLMPWLLSFAAGAMLYVVVEELIPGAHLEDHSSRGGTLGVMAGFLLMMILDVALG